MSRQFPRTAVALAVLASGLLTAWNAPLAAALQYPDAWPSAEAPDVPTLTVPADTDDPGLRLTGTGEAGGIVSVVDQDSGDDLCITEVPADGRWSCLPVENLTDGQHLLTPFAVDVTGGRTPGPPGELVVATGLPERPVLTSPAPGETVRVGRPKLVGRADPGANVMVTARAAAGADVGRRTVLCGAAVAFDGSWSCAANRDLADGEQWLTVAATDRVGNGISGEFVRVRVATGGATPASSPSVAAASRLAKSGPAASPAASPVAPRPQPSNPVASRPANSGPGAMGSAAAASSPSVVAVPAVAPSRATSPTVSTRPAVPAPSATATVSPPPTPALTAAPTRTPAIGLGASPVVAAARPPAAPVVAAQGWSGRPTADGWRGGLAGVLLVLTGLGLITRRVFARRNGAPRR
ncbi:hypothetical protein ACGF0D_07045 [Kitasatospora sp. NPDC048298]|uniref:hypothetical protein n=1 Tax=Kitasatospora sp. NPDC048298 TaxID=3364049 RepID=UPI0037227D36